MTLPDSSPTRLRRTRLLGAGVLVLALGSVWISELAIFAAFATFLWWVTLPPLAPPGRRASRWLIALAFVLSTVGLMRFASRYALAGILAASKSSIDKGTVSRLREILFAEDRARQLALVDPDGDRIGGALLLGALAGREPPRGTSGTPPQLLDEKYKVVVGTSLGPASALGDYLFIVCLPTSHGLSAEPGVPVDEQQAERRFIAYAWPVEGASSYGKVFAIDEHERILVFANRGPRGELVFRGAERPPPCDAASTGKYAFSAWEGKKARDFLPGSKPQPSPGALSP